MDGRFVGHRVGLMLLDGFKDGEAVGNGVGLGGSVKVTVPVIVLETQSILEILIRSVAFSVIINDSLFRMSDS